MPVLKMGSARTCMRTSLVLPRTLWQHVVVAYRIPALGMQAYRLHESFLPLFCRRTATACLSEPPCLTLLLCPWCAIVGGMVPNAALKPIGSLQLAAVLCGTICMPRGCCLNLSIRQTYMSVAFAAVQAHTRRHNVVTLAPTPGFLFAGGHVYWRRGEALH
jgi:hypothetical protein